MAPIIISKDNVVKAVKTLKENSSSGHDTLPAIVFKKTTESIGASTTTSFYRQYKHG